MNKITRVFSIEPHLIILYTKTPLLETLHTHINASKHIHKHTHMHANTFIHTHTLTFVLFYLSIDLFIYHISFSPYISDSLGSF